MIIVGAVVLAAIGAVALTRKSRAPESREDLATRAEHHRRSGGLEPGGSPNPGTWSDHGGAGG